MEKSATPVDDFIAGLDDDRRDDIVTLDALIRERMPDAERVLWEGLFWGGSEQQIIGYDDWSYARRDGSTVDWFRVGLATQKNHISVYLNVTEDGEYLAKRYADRLGKVKIGSAAVSFTRVANVDLDELARLLSLAATAGTDGAVRAG